MRGSPIPKTNATKRLQQGSNSRRRRANLELDAKLEAGVPTPPPYITGEALQEWARLSTELKRRGVLTLEDRSMMALTCEAYADWRKLKAICNRLKKYTIELTGSMGQKIAKRRVEFDLCDRAEKKYFRYLAEWGMTAATRTRVKAIPRAKKKDPLDEFF